MATTKKSNEFIAFGWTVPQDGYEWIDAHEAYMPPRWGKGWAPAERWLVLRGEARHHGIRRYDPLQEETSLFRRFADTPPTEEGILQFTRQYGRLGVGTLVLPTVALAFCLSEEGQEQVMKSLSDGTMPRG